MPKELRDDPPPPFSLRVPVPSNEAKGVRALAYRPDVLLPLVLSIEDLREHTDGVVLRDGGSSCGRRVEPVI